MLLYWIWYAQLGNLSLHIKQQLLEHFRDPEEIYFSESERFEQLEWLTGKELQALEDKDLSQAQKILQSCAEKGISIITFTDGNYPARLRSIFDAPMVLYVKGTLPDWHTVPVIGVVGTREATPYGLKMANRFGGQIAACGALVVSGIAKGCDAMAMLGALDNGGAVVGVLGCGVDVVYPAANRQLFARTVENGCLISEYPPGTRANSWRFPARNRIISGMSNGVLVVEAPERSGALSTANHAFTQGREIFAIPGNVDAPNSAGSNALLQERAITALSGWDVVKEYAPLFPGKVEKRPAKTAAETPLLKVAQTVTLPENPHMSKTGADKKSIDKEEKSTYSVLNNPISALSDTEQAVLACIERDAVLVDDIVAKTGLLAGAVKSVLTKLALKKLIMLHPGGRVSRKF